MSILRLAAVMVLAVCAPLALCATDALKDEAIESPLAASISGSSGWVIDHAKIYDLTPYPNAIRFATQNPGTKYCKMLTIQGIEAINRHYDVIAVETTRAVLDAQSEIDPFNAKFRGRTGGN